MIRVFVKSNQIYSDPIKFILKILAKGFEIPLVFEDSKTSAQLIFDHLDSTSAHINVEFYNSLLIKGVFIHEAYFKNKPCIISPENGKPDWLATAFYMINAFQEYSEMSGNNLFDQFGRFKYENSYQNRFDCIEDNLVQNCFLSFCESHEILKEYSNHKSLSNVFISHDIDTIHGSLLQDGLWALKNKRIDIIMKLVMNEILLRPGWKNIDKIVRLHNENDLKSTFFWLATKKISSNKVKNADYVIGKLSSTIKTTHSNGLHKSAYNTTIDDELSMLPFTTTLNRYHFLKFTLPDAWKALEDSQITFDASLGFAERCGFRNSYGLPFKPYNMQNKSSYNFIEVPLNVMDGTLHRYMKIPKSLTAAKVIEFIEKNKLNSIISILWHNTYFTDYKYSGYLQEYKKVLLYLYESGIKSITPQEIIKKYGE